MVKSDNLRNRMVDIILLTEFVLHISLDIGRYSIAFIEYNI